MALLRTHPMPSDLPGHLGRLSPWLDNGNSFRIHPLSWPRCRHWQLIVLSQRFKSVSFLAYSWIRLRGELPNNSEPLSIVLFPFLSNASQASSEDGLVQEILCLEASALMSKSTPSFAFDSWNPSPATSITIGETQSGESGSHSHGFEPPPSKVRPQPPTPPPLEVGVGVGFRHAPESVGSRKVRVSKTSQYASSNSGDMTTFSIDLSYPLPIIVRAVFTSVFIEWLSKRRPALNRAKGGTLTSTIGARFDFRRVVKEYIRLLFFIEIWASRRRNEDAIPQLGHPDTIVEKEASAK
jgi:hypothetical protein